VAEATSKLTAMLDDIKENDVLIQGIAQASQEQSTAIDQVTTAIRQMDEMTQHNAALVEETNAAVEQTQAQANELDTIVEIFVTNTPQPTRRVAATRRPARQASAASRVYLTEGSSALKSDWNEF
jgi:methyl-accepting chemotaxis protein